ncbi:MAG: MBL fold metallo-hydrolase, partial [Nitrospinae bacterium]|nr:MBL fold metallo-hydrolase [Nitrospinota bacterium]
VICALCVIAGIAWPRLPAFAGEDPLTITLIDVGQGQSVFIEFPNRETLLLDGGGFYKNSLDVGKLVVAPFLLHRGIRKIDYLGATHSDNDHISGLESILDVFPVQHYLDRAGPTGDRRLERLREKARSKGAVPLVLQTGKPIRIGEVKLVLLHPDKNFIEENGNGNGRIGNDLSLVLRLEYRDFSLLLTGDIGEKAESHLIAQHAPLQSTFLIAPHHGSRFSNTLPFIRAVHPRMVLFSSGYLNRMRHPHPDVLKRYESVGVEIRRTDRHGALTLSTDGFTHRIETHENL